MKRSGVKDGEYIMNGGISSTEEYTKSLSLKLSPEVINQIKSWRKEIGFLNPDEVKDKLWYFSPEQEAIIEKLIPDKGLRERFREYGLCGECQQPNTHGFDWCQFCNSKHFQQDFDKWTSGNKVIDEFIQKHQLGATSFYKVLEWIPHEKFTNIEYLAEGGFSKVYKAMWTDGMIKTWKKDSKQWGRGNSNEKVVLKVLKNSQNITAEFLNEIGYYKILRNEHNSVARCYGISQDYETKNYIIVMGYIKGGNLRQFLRKYGNKLSFQEKMQQLYRLVKGLKDIHDVGLVHKDLHPGNILNARNQLAPGHVPGMFNAGFTKSTSIITDLGLCRPANETNKSKVHGVLPYVAPEVLLGKGYTQSSDIYSFGIIASEILNCLPPYHDVPHDQDLADKICSGLRPKFNAKMPQLLENLISCCWDSNPSNRPTANEIEKVFHSWLDEFELKLREDTQFYRQYKEIEEVGLFNQTPSMSFSYQNHPQAIYTSQFINTKQIAKLFQESKEKALKEELKKIEREISQPLTDDLRELVNGFIQTHKKRLKDRKDKEARNKFKELREKLKEKGLGDEDIEKFIKYCERFIESEKQLEQEEIQAQVEITTNK